jgi:hypothetical protein
MSTFARRSFVINGAPFSVVSNASGTIYDYSLGSLNFSEGKNSWSGTLSNIVFSRGANGVIHSIQELQATSRFAGGH